MLFRSAFARLDMVEALHRAVQGFKMENCAKSFRRARCRPQKRPDGLKVYEVVYTADFIDNI